MPFLPALRSAHGRVPLGRCLDPSPPIGPRQFRRLADVTPALDGPVSTAIGGTRTHGFEASGDRSRDSSGAAASRLRDVFTPTQPKSLGPLFVGRNDILNRLIFALEDERAHVVLFGARGRGKTSLANAVASLATAAGHLVLRQSCGAGTTTESLFRGAIGSASLQALAPAQRNGLRTAAEMLPAGPFGPDAAINVLRHLTARQTLVIVDEFDRIACDDVRTAITETIKGLSDLQAPVSMLLVGVSESLSDLLGRHPSVERNVLGLHLARMNEGEIQTLLDGARTVGLEVSAEAAQAIRRCSRGMPYYAHLLGLLSGRTAEQRGSRRIERSDFLDAATLVWRKLLAEYSAAMAGISLDDETMQGLLLAAMAPCDEHDRFTLEDMIEHAPDHLAGINAKTAARLITQLSAIRSGPLQIQQTAHGARFSFVHPALAHLLLLLHECGLTWAGREQLAHA